MSKKSGKKAAHGAPSAAATSSKGLSKLEKGLLIGLIVVLIVAVLAVAAGVVLYKAYTEAQVPEDAAAKVNDTYILEEDVAEWISQYRIAYGLEDDDDYLSALTSADENAAMFRIDVINQLALSLLINQKAEELGVTPTDEEAQAQIDALKEALAFGDDDVWADTLAIYNLTEESLLEQYKTNLAEDAICEAQVEYRDATDEELLAYIQSYLAGTTQKHAYRIVFESTYDEGYEECLAAIAELEEAGELTVETFSELAVLYSIESGVETTGGSYAWSGASMVDEAKEALEYVDVGECSEAETVTYSDGTTTVQIFFCDAEYTFASASELTELPDDIDDELMDEIRAAAAEVVYEVNCNAYLTWLLSEASITYYPIPEDAEYNVTVFD